MPGHLSVCPMCYLATLPPVSCATQRGACTGFIMSAFAVPQLEGRTAALHICNFLKKGCFMCAYPIPAITIFCSSVCNLLNKFCWGTAYLHYRNLLLKWGLEILQRQTFKCGLLHFHNSQPNPDVDRLGSKSKKEKFILDPLRYEYGSG